MRKQKNLKQRGITPKQAVKALNELLVIDPQTIRRLCRHRVHCNDKLAGHPTVQVRCYVSSDTKARVPNVGMIGILNGIFGVNKIGHGWIAANYTGNVLTSFVLIDGNDSRHFVKKR